MANPKVEIRPVRRPVVHGGHNGDWVVWCRTGDCEYADTAVRKTEAQSLQRKHARGHRTRRQTTSQEPRDV